MSIIHRTTITPTKLELLAAWLPEQPWFRGAGAPELAKAGGFRLDDPAGAVGIEFLAVTDVAGPEPVTYLVPMTYRGAPLPDAADALIGTVVHGVLGERWVYDGPRDPLLTAQLAALVRGDVPAHDQSVDGALDPTVHTAPGEGRPEIVRVLEPGSTAPAGVTAEWRAPDGSLVRGAFAVVRAG
ncbi:1,4-alpha-glucan branching protein [Streptomyces sp. NPDC088785]|uniref:maltokinase N-terminal cap-like domain-containing protein n=1 Tax=Streptomyces sp. NPDC088785 TaxID=3365897 RepID=UPI00381E1067